MLKQLRMSVLQDPNDSDGKYKGDLSALRQVLAPRWFPMQCKAVLVLVLLLLLRVLLLLRMLQQLIIVAVASCCCCSGYE